MLLWRKGSGTPKPGLTKHVAQLSAPPSCTMQGKALLISLYPTKMKCQVLPDGPLCEPPPQLLPAGCLTHPRHACTDICQVIPGARPPWATHKAPGGVQSPPLLSAEAAPRCQVYLGLNDTSILRTLNLHPRSGNVTSD